MGGADTDQSTDGECAEGDDAGGFGGDGGVVGEGGGGELRGWGGAEKRGGEEECFGNWRRGKW